MNEMLEHNKQLSPEEKRALLAQLLQKKAQQSDTFPLSSAQQGLWFLSQLAPESPVYNVPIVLSFSGVLDREILRRSLQEIIRRHAVLRTSFPLIDEQPRQRVADDLPLAVAEEDFRHVPFKQRERETHRRIQAEISRPFDLQQGPIIRAALLCIGEEEHVFIITIHHIAFDGWSINIFLHELATIYQAFLQGSPSPLLELSGQYTDYALWQQQWLQSEHFTNQLEYWKTQLANLPRMSTLPTDRPRPSVQTFRGTSEKFRLDTDLLTGLKTLSHKAKVSLFMTLLAAYVVLLARYNGEQELIIGVPMAHRNHQEFKDLLGYLVNTVVLRFKLSRLTTFWEFLQQVRQVVLEAYTYQDMPFEKLVEVLHPERHLSTSPLFQVMFAFQDTTLRKLSLPGLSIDVLDMQPDSAKFDLTLDVKQDEQGVTGKCEYNTDLFDKNTILRMICHFQRLLHGIVDEPHRPLTAFPLLTEEERRRLLVEWNTTTSTSFPHKCVHQLFEEQVQRTPNATAVMHEDRTLTYHDLNQQANALAHYLAERGVTTEICVGLCVERSLQMIVGVLGILKAGGMYVPLDPTYPAMRQQLILEDMQAPLVLTQQSLSKNFQAYPGKIVCIDTDWTQIANYPPTAPDCRTIPENGVYIIYTSGSTGRPKGVLIQHNSLVNYISGFIRSYKIAPGERLLQFASLSFDTSAEEIFSCLISGATLVLRNDNMLSSARTFLNICQQWGITVLELPTAYWHELIRGMIREGVMLPDSIRLTIIGTERALPEMLAPWRQVAGVAVRLINAYGPTESTITATMWEAPQTFVQQARLREIPIGRVIQNVQAYIVDAEFQPVPIGVPGELYLGGQGLARGYLHRPETTAQQFVPDPFSGRPGARLYKTGDKARYLPDGNIEFLGRIDHQVKIRGFRVELQEIESVLREHPHIREALVLSRHNEFAHVRLIAYVTADAPVPDEGSIQYFLRERLPEYMAPSSIMFLKELPRTAGGKIDHHALPVPEISEEQSVNSYAAPRNQRERELTVLWKEVLGVAQVGIHDNFFDAGGHSLQAIQLISKIASKLHYELSIKDILSAPTVAALARKLEQMTLLETSDQAPPQAERPGPVPENLSPSLRIERRSALSLFALDKIAPVDAASLSYLIASDFSEPQVVKTWFADLPFCRRIIDTFLGRTASIVLPCFDTELYTDEAKLVRVILDGLRLAKQLGARTVSLTGLLPSATQYGRTIQTTAGEIPGLPPVTTGHATTAATVVLTVKRILEESQRDLTQECVGVLGLGSIGMASLYLMLHRLPHPREIILCDLYSKLPALERVKQDIMTKFGFRGPVHIGQAYEKQSAPPALYEATLIIGATNIPAILDVDRLHPGALIVDDSGPHCFDPALAIKRLHEQNDILFTEGGVLQLPYKLQETRFLPQELSQQKELVDLERVFAKNWTHHPLYMTGCIFSGLLSSHFEQLQPTVGIVETETSGQHYEKLEQLGFQAAGLHCEEYTISPEQIRRFRNLFGGSF